MQPRTDDHPLRIGVVGARDPQSMQGGIETYARTVYPHLVRRGYRVSVFTRSCYGASSGIFDGVEYVPVFSLRSRSFETALYAPLAILCAKREGCVVLHVHAIGPSMFVPLAKLLRMRVVVRHVGRCYERKKWGPFAQTWLRISEWVASRFADAVTFLNQQSEREFREVYGKRCRTAVIENAVPEAPTIAATDKVVRHGLESNRYLLYVGRLVPEKSVETLIAAYALTRRFREGWKLAVVGATDFDARYARQLHDLASAVRGVVFTGTLYGEELSQFYAHAGAFVLPSTHEGMSFSLLEAMSHGLPCIATDIAANRALELPESHYVRPGDAPRLAAAVDRTIDEWTPRHADEQVRATRQRFSIGRLVRELADELALHGARPHRNAPAKEMDPETPLRTPPGA